MHALLSVVATVVAIAVAPFSTPGSTITPDIQKILPACALVERAASNAILRVPFRVVDGRIYVAAKVDGKGPFVFVVDTGASGMGRADAGLVTTLDLSTTGSGQTSDGLATAEVKTVRLASVDLGGFVRRDLEVLTRDYSSKLAPEAAFSGILGVRFSAMACW